MHDKAGVVIAVDKPRQWTSFQVVNKLKWHIRRTFGLKKIKIGHAGTLDPLASGLLLVCVGSATKRIEELQAGTKVYSGTMVLGATTPCYDLEQAVDRIYPSDHITPELVDTVRQQFIGEIEQVPPIYSAVKVDGRRAYLSARDGEIVNITPKRVTIDEFEVLELRKGDNEIPTDYTLPSEQTLQREPRAQASSLQSTILPSEQTHQREPGAQASSLQSTILPSEQTHQRELYRNPQGEVPDWLPQLDFRITCGKGTYIRSVARDFGEALGSGAFLSALRRERIGNYTLADAISIDEIESTITVDNPSFSILSALKN